MTDTDGIEKIGWRAGVAALATAVLGLGNLGGGIREKGPLPVEGFTRAKLKAIKRRRMARASRKANRK